ncbi:MAG TPA: prolyl oligopeptidase family serine peptidase [Planctomicrobium sp.]|nr:prolyl oligopeptidase family serine peptidase [Planctomicrobium sp.]
MRSLFLLIIGSFLALAATAVFAQAPAGTPAREIPPPGLEVPDSRKAELTARQQILSEKVALLAKRKSPEIDKLLPDVEIFARAIQLAIDGNTFYSEQDIKNADRILDVGLARAEELSNGTSSWTKQTGLVVRGYRSRLDGTVQPYGLVIGPDVTFDGMPVRCDIWFRGRSEKRLELQFIHDRLTSAGEYQLSNGIMLHPLGRYCNANRFAGEVDVFEALEHAQANYAIDPDRIAVGGFSMGGAACWGFTVHHPTRWFASYPGAGFSETYRFLGMDKFPERLPASYQQKLWNLYDAHVLAENLFNVPTIAYSGDKDRQKMAADIMVESAATQGLVLPHVIGPDTAHKIHPDSKKIIAERLAVLAEAGRVAVPPSIRFTTFTLKYNQCGWITIDSLGEHWTAANVHADLVNPESPSGITIKTHNVTGLTLQFDKQNNPFTDAKEVSVGLDGQLFSGLNASQFESLRLAKEFGKWKIVTEAPPENRLVKRHNLQGPIDDALMDSFLFVQPTGEFASSDVKTWVHEEMTRAARNWQRQMRGEARLKQDTTITDADIRDHNLILWGCPQSNSLMKRVLDQLPVEWSSSRLVVGQKQYDPARDVLVLVYPNPLNPDRYIVFNSGLTYREFDYENNARQTPKLPDWAVIDTTVAPNDMTPGNIRDADFFDEFWQVKNSGR